MYHGRTIVAQPPFAGLEAVAHDDDVRTNDEIDALYIIRVNSMQ